MQKCIMAFAGKFGFNSFVTYHNNNELFSITQMRFTLRFRAKMISLISETIAL